MWKKKSIFLLFSLIAILSSCEVVTTSTSPPTSLVSSGSATRDSTATTDSSNQLERDELSLALEEVLGEYMSLFPVYDSDTYQLDIFTQQNSKTLRIVPHLKDKDSEKALADYSVVLRLNEFLITDDNGVKIAQKRVSEYQILVIQAGLEYQDFVIYTYIYQDKATSWPEEAVLSVLGKSIPEVNAPYFQYQIQQITTETYAIVIASYGITSSYISTYTEKLMESDYYVEQVYYYYVADKDDVEILYYFDTENNYMYLQAYLII